MFQLLSTAFPVLSSALPEGRVYFTTTDNIGRINGLAKIGRLRAVNKTGDMKISRLPRSR